MTGPASTIKVGNLRVIQVISGLAVSAGGPSYSVPRLNEVLNDAGVGSEVFTVEPSTGEPHVSGPRIRSFHREYGSLPIIQGMGFAGGLLNALLDEREKMQVVHSHGLWRMANIYAAQAVARRNLPLIVSPRGMLNSRAIAFSRVKKAVFWTLFQKAALSKTSCFHATSISEYDDLRAIGLKQPVAIIPNGVDVPDQSILDRCLPATEPYILSLGRIHRKKALDSLIHAWAVVERSFPDHRLKIVGPAEENYDKELRQLITKLSLSSVDIVGPVYGLEKVQLMAGAEVFALSSLTENFGNTVAESLSCATPVISTVGAPWGELETHRCGWWINHGVEPMAAALRSALSESSSGRRAMGARGRAWMTRDFSWSAVASKMIAVYRWVIDGSLVPSCVCIE